MNVEDVVAYLEGRNALPDSGWPTIAFDTNAIFGDTRVDLGVQLIDEINRANDARGAFPKIEQVVPSVVLHEKIRQMVQRRGDDFDLALPLAFLSSKKLIVQAFDQPHAIEVAQRLHRLYPNRGDWRAFKKRRCLDCLKVSADVASGDGSDCGATVDWLIAGQAEAQKYLLVTNDRRDEFKGMALKTTVSCALEAAKRVRASRTS